jgi:predicted nucleic acid-binding protein
MPVIVDSSAVLGLIFPDEDGAYSEAVVRATGADQGIVPELFWFELRNALLIGERRHRIAPSDTAAFLADLPLLRLEIDHEPPEEVVFALARSHHLTIYDATYLELAQRRSLPLATIDRALHRAAKATGVSLFAS